MFNWLNLYHSLPYFLRSTIASVRGYQLHSWRYGEQTESLIAEALQREMWTVKQWRDWQAERLSYVLHRAATKVPYYKQYWQKQRQSGNNASWEYLENWPVLEKSSVREQPRAFVADDCDPRKMFCDHTSGTTGTPLSIWEKKSVVEAWYALFEARTRRWFGVTYNDRWGILGGQLIVDVHVTTPPYWVWNAGLNQLYLSLFHLKPETCKDYLKAINRYGVEHLISYPSSLFQFARMIEEQNLEAPHFKYLMTNSEALQPQWRDVIRRVFNCPIQSTYGMAELTYAGSECEKGVLHEWPETGILEVFKKSENSPISGYNAGRFILTGLINPDMPFIRYNVGDWGFPAKQTQLCSCGRNLPVLRMVEGRTGDMIQTPDGRSIFWANNIFFGVNIHKLQVIQESVSRLRLLVIPAKKFSAADYNLIEKKVRQRVGDDMKIIIEIVDVIPVSKNGKFKSVINNLPENEK